MRLSFKDTHCCVKAVYTRPQMKKQRQLLCQHRSVQSKLWFGQWSCMDARVGL